MLAVLRDIERVPGTVTTGLALERYAKQPLGTLAIAAREEQLG